MATFSDGGDVVLSSSTAGPNSSFSSPGDMRELLQNLLDSKEKQLQQAGTLGQQLLTQRMELEERIRQLQELDLDEGDGDDVREKYRELADSIKAWDDENEQLSSAFGLKRTNGLSMSPPAEISRGEIERSMERSKASATGSTAAQSSRRAKNAAHRADDVEFAFEIGSGLLSEVRRLQALLAERDKIIQDMKEEKDDIEKTVESLRTALHQQEQSADKFKEENWNLEVTLQELRTQSAESQATSQRLESEQKRLTKLLTSTREAVDHHKNESERHQNAYQELKAKHETDVAQARRQNASLQRDKSDLQSAVDSLKAEVAKASRKLPRLGFPNTPNGAMSSAAATPAQDDDDIFSAAASTNNRKKLDSSAIFPPDGFDPYDSSPENSPSRPFLAPNHPTNEIEALQQRLAHAQRQINTLKGSLQREKELRIEYKRKLDSSPAPNHDEEEEEQEEQEEEMFPPVEEAKPRPRLTPFRVGRTKGGRKGRGGLTLLQRLAAHSPGSEFADDEDLDAVQDSSLPLPALSLPITTNGDDEDQVEEGKDDESDLRRSTSSRTAASNRTSVDGMDPAFANILRRSTSGRAISHGSPLRHAVLGRSVRGKPISRRNRGGAAFQEARPPSFAGEPEALANELGQFGFSNLENTFELPEPTRETGEMACQTDFEEVPVPQVIVQSPTLPQVDPEPVILPARSDASLQTEGSPVPARTEMAVQHEDLSPHPVLVSCGTFTDPQPEPQRPVLSTFAVQTEPVVEQEPEPQPQLESEPLPQLLYSDAQIETVVEAATVKQDMNTQTSPAVTSEVEIQTSKVVHSDADVQVAVEVTPRVPVRQRSFAESSVGDDSGDATIILGLAQAGLAEREFLDEEDARTETGSVFETDTDDFVDARQSQSLATPTESMEDYHSIMTVTDNDYSDSDEESIKASRLPSRQGMSTSPISREPSPPTPSTPSPPSRTYESVGVSAEIVSEKTADETIASNIPPSPAKPELRETSIQTDEWMPLLPSVVSAPPSPGAPSSPALFRIGPPSQQFQFISPPPSAGPTTVSQQFVIPPSSNSPLRDSTLSFIPRPRTSPSERRQSIESTLSSAAREEALARSRTPSNVSPGVVDKSRPPMMTIPPPPRQPPPPNAMPPPSFIPEKRQQTFSNASQEGPPPRPSSPPPPELIQRATTPTFGAVLSVPGGRPFGLRHHPSSTASSQGGIRQLPSTGSFRSTGRPPHSSPSAISHSIREREHREMSTTSLTSGPHSLESQRSSISSDRLAYDTTPQRPAVTSTTAQPPAGSSTDPNVIHAITQTMIGEFLYKYTRKAIGKGHGERRHKRFFWVHPYTRTLYWSAADPGSSNVSESSAKSAYVEAVRSVLDPNPMPPGIYQYSVVVSTPQREMKFTAPTKERHDIWLSALQYLLTRPGAATVSSPGNVANGLRSPVSLHGDLADSDGQRPGAFASPQSQRSVRTSRTGISVDSWNSTPRGRRSQSQLSTHASMGKRSGTPAVEYLRYGGAEGPYSPSKDFEHIPSQDEGDLSFELHDGTLSDEGYEGLENVRACCDGRHTVGRGGKEHVHHHHHHHHHDHPPATKAAPNTRTRDHLDPNPQDISRPTSPAWSFRSRAGSTHSSEGTGFFSRFGTRRSKPPTTTSERR
ncbi:hypothetical protein PHLGIDRAFT_515660 [Phlebiopsis gigantea 11061_1 CR5-6]|uniref:PH domain-containing protein n=1 Tax=Phlebiopsis gigantea (strain 11061_1 CR5-6) TaxID=745531 RepID=A0A0C3S9P4_PHLG1|nr:hypothetical protein PHLGIDRAFT_515660 [Phlebiopsis gigantea 11061_1 CR5-6]